MLEWVFWSIYQICGVAYVIIMAILGVLVAVAAAILSGFVLLRGWKIALYYVGVALFSLADLWRWACARVRPRRA